MLDYKMRYKTVLHRFEVASLVEDTKGVVVEAEEWNAALNKYAQDGWTIKNGGSVASGLSLVFWALLEMEQKEEGF